MFAWVQASLVTTWSLTSGASRAHERRRNDQQAIITRRYERARYVRCEVSCPDRCSWERWVCLSVVYLHDSHWENCSVECRTLLEKCDSAVEDFSRNSGAIKHWWVHIYIVEFFYYSYRVIFYQEKRILSVNGGR